MAAFPMNNPRVLAAALVLVLAAPAPRAVAQPADVPRDGLFVTVPNPIDDVAVKQIDNKVRGGLKRQSRPITTVVFDFNPNGQPVGTSKVYAALELADYIRRLRQDHPKLHTVAFVHGEVTNHTVLPVFACHELVMSPGAKIGDVMRGEKQPLTPAGRQAYEDLARQVPAKGDLIRKMLDRGLTVRKVTLKDNSVRYIAEDRLKQAEKELGPLSIEPGVPDGLGPGTTNTVFDSKRAAAYGLCRPSLYGTRQEVARAYNLTTRSLREVTLPADKTPVVWRIDLAGTVNKARLDSLERRLKAAVGRGANLIFLYLDCEGGETVDVATTARMLTNLRDNAQGPRTMTVAYVPPKRALGAATFLALGCDEIVMSKDAVLGDFEYLKNAGAKLKATADMLTALAEQQGYPRALFRATLEPGVVLVRAQKAGDPSFYQLMTVEEVENSGGAWLPTGGKVQAAEGDLLKINAKLAREWDVAAHTNVETVEALYNLYQVDPGRARVSRDDWLDKVAEFFRDDIVKVFLIMLGIAGLILELKMPGIGIPGIVAAICFILFFWAHSFVGQFTLLAVLLFVLGLVLIGLEIFVLPGFGVTGISGIALVVASLVLVTLERMPETSEDWLNVGATVTTMGISLVAAIVGACVLAWYLPHIPFANRLVLQPPAESESGYDQDALGGRPEHAQALLGAIGVAATTLRPAGKARFGDEFLDVVAEGDYVNPGSRVQVIEIEGNRIVVKEV
jgi:membrane-bound ClpP family serine protease